MSDQILRDAIAQHNSAYFRDGTELRTEDNINFLLTHCALGDGIASLPAIRYARRTHTLDLAMTVWAPRHMLPLFEHLIGGPGLTFMALDDFKMVRQKGDDRFAGACVINSVHHNNVTRNRYDMVAFSFATLLDMMPECHEDMSYPNWAPLGPRTIEQKYVVLPVGATNDVAVFHPNSLEPLIHWLHGKGYLPVLTGSQNTHVHTLEKGKPILLKVQDRVDQLKKETLALCRDTRNTLDLMQLRDLCGHAAAVVGIDGGTLHLAGTTNVPIVYGCTRVSPRHRPIIREGVINKNVVHTEPRDLACAGCQSNWTLMFKHNFAKCAYEDNKCTKVMHADDFINGLKQLGVE